MSLTNAFREEWTAWIDKFSKQHQELNGSLVVIGSKGAVHLVAQGVTFNGLSADWKDGEDSVVISLGSLNHVVSGVIELDLEETSALPGVVRVKSSDGTTTLLHLS